MTAYRLTATHSITRDRARVNGSTGIIHLRCTITVYLLALQPVVDTLLHTFNPRHSGISIHDVTSHPTPYGFGAKTWNFTMTLHTTTKKVRTRTWWGRQLPTIQLEVLPSQLLGRFEALLSRTWSRLSRSQPAFAADSVQFIGELQMVA